MGTAFACFPDSEKEDASLNRSLETASVGWNSVWMTGRTFDNSTDCVNEVGYVRPLQQEENPAPRRAVAWARWHGIPKSSDITGGLGNNWSGTGDTKVSNRDGDGDVIIGGALPLFLVVVLKSAFPVSSWKSVHPMAGLRPHPNHWTRPVSSQMVSGSTVGSSLYLNFGRTVKRDGRKQ